VPETCRTGTAAIVGASGFIGSALVQRLASAGVPVESFTREAPFVAGPSGKCPGTARLRTVYWLASSVNPVIAEERPDLVDLDMSVFEHALEALEADTDPPTTVLLSSGGTVYDPGNPPPYHEASPVKARTAYARSKLALEQALCSSSIPPGRRLVVRVANAYGPGQQARRGQGVVAHWLKAAANHESLVLMGDAGTVRDYIYIGDLVDALVAVHHADRDLPPILNVGSGRGTTLGELAQTVLDVVDDPSVGIEVRPARSFDLSRTWLDTTLATRTLGWRPRTSLSDGVVAAWKELVG
jgi:UDP-glucose 4-epimerase